MFSSTNTTPMVGLGSLMYGPVRARLSFPHGAERRVLVPGYRRAFDAPFKGMLPWDRHPIDAKRTAACRLQEDPSSSIPAILFHADSKKLNALLSRAKEHGFETRQIPIIDSVSGKHASAIALLSGETGRMGLEPDWIYAACCYGGAISISNSFKDNSFAKLYLETTFVSGTNFRDWMFNLENAREFLRLLDCAKRGTLHI